MVAHASSLGSPKCLASEVLGSSVLGSKVLGSTTLGSTTRWLAALGMVLAGTAMVMGCGGGDDDDAGGSGSNGGKDEEMVRYSYDQYWETYDNLAASTEALQDGHYLETFAAGDALASALTDFGQQQGQGLVRKTGRWNRHEIESIKVEGDQATVQDCFVDDSNLADFVNGQAKDINGASLRRLEVTMEQQKPSEWKVTQIRTVKTWRFVETDKCP